MACGTRTLTRPVMPFGGIRRAPCGLVDIALKKLGNVLFDTQLPVWILFLRLVMYLCLFRKRRTLVESMWTLQWHLRSNIVVRSKYSMIG